MKIVKLEKCPFYLLFNLYTNVIYLLMDIVNYCYILYTSITYVLVTKVNYYLRVLLHLTKNMRLNVLKQNDLRCFRYFETFTGFSFNFIKFSSNFPNFYCRNFCNLIEILPHNYVKTFSIKWRLNTSGVVITFIVILVLVFFLVIAINF